MSKIAFYDGSEHHLDSAGKPAGSVITLGADGRPEWADASLADPADYQAIIEKDAENGYAGLDGDGLIAAEQIPTELVVPDYSGADEGDVLTIVSGVPAWAPPA